MAEAERAAVSHLKVKPDVNKDEDSAEDDSMMSMSAIFQKRDRHRTDQGTSYMNLYVILGSSAVIEQMF